MKNPLRAAVSNNTIQQLVQRLADEYLSQSDEVSHGLFENIAQSLLAVKTRLSLIEKKLPSEYSDCTNDIQQLNKLLQTALSQIRILESRSFSNTLSNLGLEAALREICFQTSIRQDFPVFFMKKGGVLSEDGLGRPQALCLYYFTVMVLEYAAREKCSLSIFLEVQDLKVMVDCHIYPESAGQDPIKQVREQLLPVLEEWIYLWNGDFESAFSTNQEMSLTACLIRQ
jgi:hypothetical protein